MIPLDTLIKKAYDSRIYLSALNLGLNWVVPFNRPHGIKILELEKRRIKTRIPYTRKNFNHIKGIHACALATLSEFTTGFLLLTALDKNKYRLIMQKLEMEYHYQAKTDATATFAITDTWLEESVIIPLKDREKLVLECKVETYDRNQNHLCTGIVSWQIKQWKHVSTKV